MSILGTLRITGCRGTLLRRALSRPFTPTALDRNFAAAA